MTWKLWDTVTNCFYVEYVEVKLKVFFLWDLFFVWSCAAAQFDTKVLFSTRIQITLDVTLFFSSERQFLLHFFYSKNVKFTF
jgi:hypothetical protein